MSKNSVDQVDRLFRFPQMEKTFKNGKRRFTFQNCSNYLLFIADNYALFTTSQQRMSKKPFSLASKAVDPDFKCSFYRKKFDKWMKKHGSVDKLLQAEMKQLELQMENYESSRQSVQLMEATPQKCLPTIKQQVTPESEALSKQKKGNQENRFTSTQTAYSDWISQVLE